MRGRGGSPDLGSSGTKLAAWEKQNMNSPKFVGHDHHRSARLARQAVRYTIVICVMACSGMSSAHQAADPDSSLKFSHAAPWMPDIISAIDDYVIDPGFNSGRLFLDHFADASNLDQEGLVTAELFGGDMVVAGLVPDGVGGGFCGDGTKLCSIGLVRYNAAGQRIPWPNPHQYGRASNNYLVYPGASSTSKFQYLRHVNVRGAYIDVLVDEPDASHPALTLGHRNVSIVTFLTDGSLAGKTKVFGNSTSVAGDAVDFYGAQMVETISGAVVVAATAYGGNGPFVAVTRLNFNNNGVLIDDNSWGFPYGGSGPNRVRGYDAPSSHCGGGFCDVIAGYVVQPRGVAQATDVYVAASIHVSGTNWDPIALKISSVTGAVKPEFNGDGWSRAVFDDANSSLDDRAAGLYVFQNDVYMAAQVSRKCFSGIGLAKLSGASGAYVPSFGSGGKLVFGGQGNSPVCFSPPGGDYPTAIAGTSSGARIGIVGYRHHGITGVSSLYDPMLAVVDGTNGQVLDFNFHPVKRADDSRYGDAVLYGIFNTTVGATSLFAVAGNGRDASAGNTLSYLAGRLIPVSSDRIFASGFDN